MYKEEREKLKRDLESNQTTKRQTIHDKKLFDLYLAAMKITVVKYLNLLTVLQK